ncbi:MAG: hypothetical protein HPM95_22370, partial [Alphaproteobacteria bacterium]|nr:hypothetical protein [Alphaproteobacteria bacterium]
MTGVAGANQFEAELSAIAKGKIAEIASAPEVIGAVKAQNETTAAYDQAKIDELDTAWRAQADAAEQPMIDAALDSEVSGYLMDVQDGSDGMFTEIFV